MTQLIFSLLIAAAILLPTVATHGDARFDQWDRNKDKKLTRDELPERFLNPLGVPVLEGFRQGGSAGSSGILSGCQEKCRQDPK